MDGNEWALNRTAWRCWAHRCKHVWLVPEACQVAYGQLALPNGDFPAIGDEGLGAPASLPAREMRKQCRAGSLQGANRRRSN